MNEYKKATAGVMAAFVSSEGCALGKRVLRVSV